MKTKAVKLYSRVFWIFVPNVMKIDPYNFELYRFKVGAFFSETQRIKVKVKADIALHGNPISELRDVTCHIGSHSVTCRPTQVNAPRLTPAMQDGTRFTYPGGMEGWVDLVDLIAPRPGVKPATFWSRVRRRTAAKPRQHNTQCKRTYHSTV